MKAAYKWRITTNKLTYITSDENLLPPDESVDVKDIYQAFLFDKANGVATVVYAEKSDTGLTNVGMYIDSGITDIDEDYIKNVVSESTVSEYTQMFNLMKRLFDPEIDEDTAAYNLLDVEYYYNIETDCILDTLANCDFDTDNSECVLTRDIEINGTGLWWDGETLKEGRDLQTILEFLFARVILPKGVVSPPKIVITNKPSGNSVLFEIDESGATLTLNYILKQGIVRDYEGEEESLDNNWSNIGATAKGSAVEVDLPTSAIPISFETSAVTREQYNVTASADYTRPQPEGEGEPTDSDGNSYNNNEGVNSGFIWESGTSTDNYNFTFNVAYPIYTNIADSASTLVRGGFVDNETTQPTTGLLSGVTRDGAKRYIAESDASGNIVCTIFYPDMTGLEPTLKFGIYEDYELYDIKAYSQYSHQYEPSGSFTVLTPDSETTTEIDGRNYYIYSSKGGRITFNLFRLYLRERGK